MTASFTPRPAPRIGAAITLSADVLARAHAFVPPRAEQPRSVVVALSGGVDSAVAAWLLKEAGHDVTGVSLRLAPDAPGGDAAPESGRCCSVDDMSDARRTADLIGIPFFAVDARARFKEAVVDPFLKAYRQGLTPIPCVACNHDVKVGDLLETARDLGAALATGHYAKKTSYRGHPALARPADVDRDQTYYLYGTPFSAIGDLELPLGDLDKPLVRGLAARIGLAVAKKPDSQEICFVPHGDHAAVVEQLSGPLPGGELVHIGGRPLRTHNGIHQFTVGQRRGTGVASPTPGEKLYVVDVDAASARVTLGPKEALAVRTVRIGAQRFAMPEALWPERVEVQVRARHRAAAARVTCDGDEWLVVFDEPVSAVALGQAAVVYAGDVLLGGGTLVERCDGAAPRRQVLAL